MKKQYFYNLVYLFVLASVFGWCVEGIWSLLAKGRLINHSAVVIGPFNMVYGVCVCTLSLLLSNFNQNSSYFKIFLTCFIGGSIIEYIISWSMELMFGFSAWDYSKYFLNINGRVCLLYSFFWGILGIFWIKIIYPYITKLLNKIPERISKKLVYFIIIFLSFDLLLTVSAINRAHDFEKNIPPKNSYERYLDKRFDKNYLKNMFNNNWK